MHPNQWHPAALAYLRPRSPFPDLSQQRPQKEPRDFSGSAAIPARHAMHCIFRQGQCQTPGQCYARLTLSARVLLISLISRMLSP